MLNEVTNNILPSDNLPIEIRQLGLYELDNVLPDLSDSAFFYEMMILGGQKVMAPYELERNMARPPVKPDSELLDVIERNAQIKEDQKKDREWWNWRAWQVHQAALAHYAAWLKAVEERARLIRRYIFDTCIKPEDKSRIKSVEDWRIIEALAMVPQVAMEDIERTLRINFQGKLGWYAAIESFISGGRGGTWILSGYQELAKQNDF